MVAGAVLTDDHRGGLHTLDRLDLGFDLPQLDAETTDLHLVVAATDEIQFPVRTPPHDITRAVHALPRCIEVSDETRRRHSGTVPVAARQARAGQVQLPGNTRRHGSQPLIQHPGDETVGRMPDLRWPQAVQRPRHHTGDGHFRGSVGVEDPAATRPRPHQRLRAGLAAEIDVAQVFERARFQALEP